jgi:methyl coenzyme M reductase beta subunit
MALKPSKQTAVDSVVEGLALLAFIAVVALLAGCDVESAEVTAKIVAEVDEKKATFSHPLKCDAWVVHSGTPGELPRARCYVRPE